MKRSLSEAYAAAQAVFQAAGFTCRLQHPKGKGHTLCIAERDGHTIRLSLSGTPASGSQQAAKLAAINARKRLRQHAAFPTP
jgi:hypothetical protein